MTESVKSLLSYSDEPGSYHPEKMYDALAERTPEEIDALSPEDRDRYEYFLARVQGERDVSYMRRFFKVQQHKEFKAVDVALWAADNLGYEASKNPDDQRELAIDMLKYFIVLIAALAQKGWIERIECPTHDRYRVAIVEGNPLVDLGDPEIEV